MAVTVVLGGQAGSEAKGKICGYLAMRGEFHAAISNFHPNAGHTWISRDGEKVMIQQLPQSVVNPNVELFISAGAAIDPRILKREVEAYKQPTTELRIHPRAMVVQPHHQEEEAKVLNKISSTLKGCGAATAEKVWRTNPDCLARDDRYLQGYVDPEFTERLHHYLRQDYNILVEVPQGYDLDINHGLEYPYCTSRQTTTAQAIADAGLPPQSVQEVIAVIRPYPIRVGNAYDKEGNLLGTSGTYLDSAEITWEEVARRAGAPEGIFSEYTTVTGKLRRVFELNIGRLQEMCRVNGVTQIALNFANYIDWSVHEATNVKQLTPKVLDFANFITEQTGVPVTLIGTGARDHHIVDLRGKFGKAPGARDICID